jgi:secretion/DNA translocation related TadE-like protein
MNRRGQTTVSSGPVERGSITVLVVAGLGAFVLLLAAGVSVCAAVLGAHRARAAADLGALAGALAVQRGEVAPQACERANGVIRRNQGRPVSCSVSPQGAVEVVVSVEVRGPLALPGLDALEAKARSRAGPSPRGSVGQP